MVVREKSKSVNGVVFYGGFKWKKKVSRANSRHAREPSSAGIGSEPIYL